MLPTKHNASGFYRIDIQKLSHLDSETKKILGYINNSWADIEYLNYLCHKTLGSLIDDLEAHHTFSALLVMSDGFYIHLSTIDKLLDLLSAKDEYVKLLVSSNRKFLKNRIQVIRNNILVHKEKPDFRHRLSELSSTDPEHGITQKILVLESDGTEKTITLKPLKDIFIMHSLLKNVEELLLKQKSEF